MEWLKSQLASWKVRVALAGGALVVATAYGTCTWDPTVVSTNIDTTEETTTTETVEVSATTGTTPETTTTETTTTETTTE